jgi:anti-sigma B factor antagonist
MRSKGKGSGPADDEGISIRRSELEGGTVVLSICGELDLASAPSLKWALNDEVQAGASRLVLDLSEVTFMDSTAIGVLVGIKRALSDGERLSLVHLTPDVQKTLEITGLESSFRIYSSVEAAVEHTADVEAPPEDQASSG